ncbi:LysR family transcriptional regulator [Halomonas sp. HNIBRBA4712]|uniref:LysR family transcriptional regulator n=1 Tax=Halomonas sp. HNIBRBA4712 TaxID=3373087 RepID=UPI003746C87A
MYDIRQLRYFVAVAEERNFRRAAKRLHITQPPLSQAIRQLEAELGATLFSRNTHGVRLTRAGEVFLAEATSLLSAVEQSARRARQAEAGEIGRLRLGYSASALYLQALTRALAALVAQRPQITLTLCAGNAQGHLNALRDGQLEAAVVRAEFAEISADGLNITQLGDEPLYALLEGSHPLASRDALRLSELAGERLLLQPAADRTFLRRQIEGLAERDGVSLAGALDVPDLAAITGFAVAGLGVAIVPKSVALSVVGALAIPLDDEGASSPLSLVYAADDAAARALDALIKPWV